LAEKPNHTLAGRDILSFYFETKIQISDLTIGPYGSFIAVGRLPECRPS
jgi:hypothetical protein